MRPVDQYARIAQRGEPSAVLAHRAQRHTRHGVQRATGTPPQSCAGIRPDRLPKNAAAFVLYAGQPRKYGSASGSSFTLRFAAATAQTPSSRRSSNAPAVSLRKATARPYALQSTTYGHRPGRKTVSLKSTITRSASGIA